MKIWAFVSYFCGILRLSCQYMNKGTAISIENIMENIGIMMGNIDYDYVHIL